MGSIVLLCAGNLLIFPNLWADISAQSSSTLFEDLPTGTYRYALTEERDKPSRSTWLFRKSGSAVVGVELMSNRRGSRLPVLSCFRGQAKDNRIIHMTQVHPPFDPGSNWESGQTLELDLITNPDALQVVSAAEGELRGGETIAAEQAALRSCIQLF